MVSSIDYVRLEQVKNPSRSKRLPLYLPYQPVTGHGCPGMKEEWGIQPKGSHLAKTNYLAERGNVWHISSQWSLHQCDKWTVSKPPAGCLSASLNRAASSAGIWAVRCRCCRGSIFWWVHLRCRETLLPMAPSLFQWVTWHEETLPYIQDRPFCSALVSPSFVSWSALNASHYPINQSLVEKAHIHINTRHEI